jgi:hypothetical protein
LNNPGQSRNRTPRAGRVRRHGRNPGAEAAEKRHDVVEPRGMQQECSAARGAEALQFSGNDARAPLELGVGNRLLARDVLAHEAISDTLGLLLGAQVQGVNECWCGIDSSSHGSRFAYESTVFLADRALARVASERRLAGPFREA